jgi:hypothetical protein
MSVNTHVDSIFKHYRSNARFVDVTLFSFNSTHSDAVEIGSFWCYDTH